MKSDKTKQKGWRIPEPLVTRLETVATHSEMAAELGRRTSERKTEAARRNAKKGGWPKGKPRKPKIETEN